MAAPSAACGKMAAFRLEQGEDAFRKIFRFYRSRSPPPDLSGVIEFSRGHPGVGEVTAALLNTSAVSDSDARQAGLQPLDQWKAYRLDGYPGFIFISNPFLPGWQHRWVRQCLKVFPKKPNICNLDLHMSPEQTADLWESSKEQLRSQKSLLEKLRWVTLGYHYNWDTKKYTPERRSIFPKDLAELSRCVSQACGFSSFQPEAGILNYYHMDSSLGIHVDESEPDQCSPLLSFSFGQSCIYLLGGLSRELAPTPMMMHSGDIMIMAGPSRLFYHAVPRILPFPGGGILPPSLSEPPSEKPLAASPPLLQPCSAQDWDVCAQYLRHSRINMTVRQVLEGGASFPVEEDTCHQQTPASKGDTYHLDETELAMEDQGEQLLPKRVKTT
uniref:Nucleic acid dioxygenase ALKBH1 n=1 Tax=Leptobrachium leishanense TaxID=445787 RepID=A0A8C5WLF1_9ANUR